MSEREPELDEPLRARLKALGDAVSATLDAESELRIVARLQAEAARAQQPRRHPLWLRGAAVLAAAAAVGLLWFGVDRRARPDEAAPHCAWGEAALRFTERADGARELALGAAGHVVLAPGAEASAQQDGACALSVRLERGSLAAELADLRPGTLKVQTPLGDVLVRGTTFSVELGDALHVVLLEGAVELLDEARVAARMTPGRALRRAAPHAAPMLTRASSEDAARVTGILRAQPASAAPEPAAPAADEPAREPRAPRSAEGLAAAEAARREGDVARARLLYAQAEQAGRPDAEIALLRHAGFEIDVKNPGAADKLLAEHQRRFPQSRLSAEAAWIGVRSLQAQGQREPTRARAQALVRAFPGTPQARAAQRLLERP